MERRLTRRELLGGFLGVSGLLMAQHLVPRPEGAQAPVGPELRVRIAHLSDFHWGYRGDWNRRIDDSLRRVLDQVAALAPAAQLLVVTGDLIQAVSDAREREKRLTAVKSQLDALKIPWLAIPGEHDTFGDQGQLFQSVIGPLYFHRVFQGLHIVGLDNVSRGFFLGQSQMTWLSEKVSGLSKDAPVLVLTHAPLYDLFTPWNWYTYDGDAVFHALNKFSRRQFLFGHIHQALDHVHDESVNRAGLPTSWPLPEPGPLVRLAPWPQGGSHPDMGLGFRVLDVEGSRFTEESRLLESSMAEVKKA